MVATISRWGNGHGVRLSRSVMEAAGLSVSDKLDVIVQKDHSILLRRLPKTKAERFMELFGDYKGDWRCQESDTGEDVGKERFE